jgi:hypothetical protein
MNVSKAQQAKEQMVKRSVRQYLREVMRNIDLESKMRPVEGEDGSIHFVIATNVDLSIEAVHEVDDALIVAAKMFRDANVLNNDRYYKHVARMVHYAMSELETGNEPFELTVRRLIDEVGESEEK